MSGLELGVILMNSGNYAKQPHSSPRGTSATLRSAGLISDPRQVRTKGSAQPAARLGALIDVSVS
jgi:hypothetical protein